MVVLTKYDVLVDTLKPPDESDFYGDTEKEIENLDMDSTAGTSASQIDPAVLSRANDKLWEMITPSEEMSRVPWVKVSGLHILPLVLSARSNSLILKTVKPGFTGTLDELVYMTRQYILHFLWAQQRGVEPEVEASIESVPSFCDAASDCADICLVLTRKYPLFFAHLRNLTPIIEESESFTILWRCAYAAGSLPRPLTTNNDVGSYQRSGQRDHWAPARFS